MTKRTSVKFTRITAFRVGQQDDLFKNLWSRYRTDELKLRSFSIEYLDRKDRARSLCLIARSLQERDLWMYVIYHLAQGDR